MVPDLTKKSLYDFGIDPLYLICDYLDSKTLKMVHRLIHPSLSDPMLKGLFQTVYVGRYNYSIEDSDQISKRKDIARYVRIVVHKVK